METSLPETLRRAVEESYGLRIHAADRIVGQGDECDVWRAETSQGRLALRVSPSWRDPAQLTRTHRLAAFVAKSVPEAIAPLATTDGTTTARWQRRPVTVYPWIEGEQLDDQDPEACIEAASLLARMHNEMLSWSGAEAHLGGWPGAPSPRKREPCPELVDHALDAQLAEIYDDASLRRGPIHHDYYERNILRRDGCIVGVIDWDESHIDVLAAEVAWAVWEFGQDPVEPDLSIERAQRFLRAYREGGGPLPEGEFRTIASLIRKRLRDEVRAAYDAGREAEPEEREYVEREVEAFRRLRGRAFEW